jgi:hypothetical protein
MFIRLLQYLNLHIVGPSAHEVNESAKDSKAMLNSPDKVSMNALRSEDVINLCVQEYVALRAEQRTRLDSANRIIHYYAVVIGAVIVGLLSIYRNASETAFLSAFHYTMLLIPMITLPFAFAQQNEEIFVRHIGDYFEEMKLCISKDGDDAYWGWESYHNRPGPRELRFTGLFRSGLLIIFSVVGLLLFIATSHPIEWYHNFTFISRSCAVASFLIIDCILLTLALWTAFRMVRKSRVKTFAFKESIVRNPPAVDTPAPPATL